MPSRLRALAVMIVMVFGGVAWGQTQLTVYNGTATNEFVPFQGWNADNAQHNQILYLAPDLTAMNGKEITQMVFYFDENFGPYSDDVENSGRLGTWTISLGVTNANTLTALDNATLRTQVYEGLMTWNHSAHTLTVTFDNEYLYSGGNLLVDFNHAAASYNRYYFYGITTTNSMAYTYNSQRQFQPKTTFTYQNASSCPSPTGLTIAAITATSATVSWTAGGSETNWVVEYSTNSDFSSAASVNVSGTPSTNLTGLTPENTYYVRVKAICGGGDVSGWRSSSVFMGYCNPAPTSRDNNGITDVTFRIGGSTVYDNSTTHPTTRPYYGNYSAQIIDVAAGDAVDVVIGYATGYTYMTYVWVDLNNNLSFESGEILASDMSASNNPTTLTLTITIPSDLPAGNYRLRIGGADSGMDSEGNPCYTGSYAVFEDYTLRITPSCTDPGLAYSNTTPSFNYGSYTTYTNTLTNPHNVTGITYSIVSQTSVDGSGNMATINTSSGQLTISKAGTVTVRASYAGGGDYCSGSAEYTLTVNCPTISAPSVTGGYRCEPGTVDLSATPGTGTGVSPSTCHWYTVPSGGSATYTNTAITTPSISATTSYYVATYDATSGCESSSRTKVTATIYNSTISYTGLSNPYAESATVNITLTSDYTSYTWTSNYGGSGSTATVTGTAYPGLEFHATASEHGCDASVDIKVTVIKTSGGLGCGVIYCSPTGGTGNGTSDDPVSLTRALNLADGEGSSTSPIVIRMKNGQYDISEPVNLVSNVIIDGGWNETDGIWTKGTTATVINRTATWPEGGSTSPRITAIEGSSKSNFILQDLTIQTANAPGYSSSTGYYGVSTYAVHLNGCSGYKFVRCQLKPGAASSGGAGSNGSSGSNASGSSAGGSGSQRGGAGGTGAGGNAANTSGTYGTGGSTGNTGRNYGTGDIGWCSGHNGGNGGNGNTGKDGVAGTAGTNATIVNGDYSEYFTPKRATNGGNAGGGGGGGQGGRGGTAACSQAWFIGITEKATSNGGNGGNGGGGGGGGNGGTGGYGGGSSFGVYHYGSTTLGTFTDCHIVSGTRGTGGNGGNGGDGGNGANGTSGSSGTHCQYTCGGDFYGGTGGTGGKGGKGGKGGAGGRGADGVSYKIAVVGTSGLTSSVTTGYTTTPSNYVTSIDYGESSKAGCTNSQIFVTKSGGSYLGSGAQYVKDQTDESTSSPSGNNAVIYYENTGLDYKALTNTTQYNPYIFITQERSLGTVGGANGICKGSLDPVKFTYGGEIKEDDYLLWRVLSADGNSQYGYLAIHADADDDAEGTSFEVDPNVLPGVGTYLIKLEIINECCGLSIPIWKKITVSQLEATIEFGD